MLIGYFSIISIFLLSSFITVAQPPPPPLPISNQESTYSVFSFDATAFPAEAEYDYVIVGGGTVGCPLAATLSETHWVLLLERGGSPQEYPDVMTKDGFLRTLGDTNAYDSPAQTFVSDDGVSNARGRILGGSSAINAGFYSRGDPKFFERKNGRGVVKWNMSLVNESYGWVEKAITFRPLIGRWQSAIRDGLLEANVTPYNGFTVDHKVGTKIGATTFDTNGRRHSAADLLNFANFANIRVALRASVERILISSLSDGARNQAAIGVVYRDRHGHRHHAMLESGGEVILCAGALGSPQLLLLSGIGPRRHLSSMGITAAYHHPNVGEFMYDNPRNGVSITTPLPLDNSLIQVVGITGNGTFIEAASTTVPFFAPSRAVFIHDHSSPMYVTVATLIEKVAGPSSAGSLRLASLDVRDNPAVRFNYFSEPEDLRRCVAGVRKVVELLNGRTMEEFRFGGGPYGGERDFRYLGAPLGLNQTEDSELEEFCRKTVTTLWHYHGGCVAGKVVDGDFKVIGIESLRVVDGSTLSVSPGTNPQATLLMMGRYVGQMMKQQ